MGALFPATRSWSKPAAARGRRSRGVATALKRHEPTIRIVAVEPAESSVLLGGQPGQRQDGGRAVDHRRTAGEPRNDEE